MEKEIRKNRDYINADFMQSSGNGVVVAILDTGCTDHPYLRDNVIGGINTTNDKRGKDNYMRDDIGHGTQVAGVIAQVAPSARLMILKFKSTSMLSFGAEALEYAINWRGYNGDKVRIINISQSWGNSPTQNALVKEATDKGILVVAAAGNEGDGFAHTSEICYPAYLPETVSVGAWDHNQNKLWASSNSNKRVDIIAPGRRIVVPSLSGDDLGGKQGWTVASGTSIATPFVSAAAALIISKFEAKLGRRLTVTEIKYELFKRTIDKQYDRRSQGRGYIDLSVDWDNFGLPKYVQMWHPERKRLTTFTKSIVPQKLASGWTLNVPNHYELQKIINDQFGREGKNG